MLEQLEGIGPITSKRMFGGVGLYFGDTFFSSDVLYLKADDSTRAEFEAVGGRAFRPYPDRAGSTQYYGLPVGILEDSDELTRWATKSIAVAGSAPTKRVSWRLPQRGSPRRKETPRRRRK